MPPATASSSPYLTSRYFTSDPRADILAGITVSLTIIPEVLAFAVATGLPPLVGLHGTIIMCAVASLFCRPGVISSTTHATAAVAGTLVAAHGTQYLLACVAMSGLLQMAFGALRLGKFIRIFPRPVKLGLINGLAIVMLRRLGQLIQQGAGVVQWNDWASAAPLCIMLALVAITVAIIAATPKSITRAVPGQLVAIGAVTALVQGLGIQTHTVGDMAAIGGGLPTFHVPDVPLTMETVQVVAPFAVAIAAIHLVKAMLSEYLVDDIQRMRSPTHIECIAQGAGNLVCGFFGAMGGCAIIGQSAINANTGGRGRLSGLACAVSLAACVALASTQMEKIPVAALIGVISVGLIDHVGVRCVELVRRGKLNWADTLLMIGITLSIVWFGLGAAFMFAVLTTGLGFANLLVATVFGVPVTRREMPVGKNDTMVAFYDVEGQVFSGSCEDFKAKFNPAVEVCPVVVINFVDSRVWDASGLAAVSEVARRFAAAGKEVRLIRLSKDARRLLNKEGEPWRVVYAADDPRYGVPVDYDDDFFQAMSVNQPPPSSPWPMPLTPVPQSKQ